MDMKTTDYI